jgi:hypothetical protein
MDVRTLARKEMDREGRRERIQSPCQYISCHRYKRHAFNAGHKSLIMFLSEERVVIVRSAPITTSDG